MIELSYRLDLSDSEIEEIIEKYYSEKDKRTKWFIHRSLEKYGDIYDYSETIYTGRPNKLRIFCPKCNDFFTVIPGNFLWITGAGCPVCSKKDRIEKLRLEGKEVFEDLLRKYQPDFELVGEYINQSTRVDIRDNTTGKIYSVIPSVVKRTHSVKRIASRGEEAVEEALLSLGLAFQKQKSFTVDEVPDLYKVRSQKLTVDFYLEYNGLTYIIEYNGEQHYREAKKFSKGGNSIDTYIKQIKRDQILNTFCGYKGWCFIVIPYTVTKEELIESGLRDIIINGNLQNTQKYFPNPTPGPVTTVDDRWEEIITWEESENE